MVRQPVFINGKYLSQATTGVQRYAAEIVRAWDDGLEEGWIDRAHYVISVIVPKHILRVPSYRHIQLMHGSTSGRLWEQVELPWKARGALLFSPYAAAPVIKGRHAVTIHDAGAVATPEQYSFGFRAYCSVVYRALGKSCHPVFTVSEFSKEELCRYFSLSAEKVRVVSPGCDHILKCVPDTAILARAGLAAGRFVLGVSSHSVIKNFNGLAAAWKLVGRRDLKLAIAGGTNRRVFGSDAATRDDTLVRLGYVSDGELRALYEAAALFAYPSFYEGFGLPPLEAMACGCPALVARTSALPEVCGDAAVYCDPADAHDIAAKISLILNDSDIAAELRGKGLARSAMFTVRSSASRIWTELLPYL